MHRSQLYRIHLDTYWIHQIFKGREDVVSVARRQKFPHHTMARLLHFCPKNIGILFRKLFRTIVRNNCEVIEKKQGVPHLRGFQYRGSHYPSFWLIDAQVGDFCIRTPTVPLTQISHYTFFFQVPKSS